MYLDGRNSRGHLPPMPTSSAIRLTRLCTTCSLSVFMLGTPYIISPPIRSARSNTCSQCWKHVLHVTGVIGVVCSEQRTSEHIACLEGVPCLSVPYSALHVERGLRALARAPNVISSTQTDRKRLQSAPKQYSCTTHIQYVKTYRLYERSV